MVSEYILHIQSIHPAAIGPWSLLVEFALLLALSIVASHLTQTRKFQIDNKYVDLRLKGVQLPYKRLLTIQRFDFNSHYIRQDRRNSRGVDWTIFALEFAGPPYRICVVY